MSPEALDFSILAPIGFVGIAAMLVLVGEAWLSRNDAHVTPWLVMICTAALALAIFTAASRVATGCTANASLSTNPSDSRISGSSSASSTSGKADGTLSFPFA